MTTPNPTGQTTARVTPRSATVATSTVTATRVAVVAYVPGEGVVRDVTEWGQVVTADQMGAAVSALVERNETTQVSNLAAMLVRELGETEAVRFRSAFTQHVKARLKTRRITEIVAGRLYVRQFSGASDGAYKTRSDAWNDTGRINPDRTEDDVPGVDGGTPGPGEGDPVDANTLGSFRSWLGGAGAYLASQGRREQFAQALDDWESEGITGTWIAWAWDQWTLWTRQVDNAGPSDDDGDGPQAQVVTYYPDGTVQSYSGGPGGVVPYPPGHPKYFIGPNLDDDADDVPGGGGGGGGGNDADDVPGGGGGGNDGDNDRPPGGDTVIPAGFRGVAGAVVGIAGLWAFKKFGPV